MSTNTPRTSPAPLTLDQRTAICEIFDSARPYEILTALASLIRTSTVDGTPADKAADLLAKAARLMRQEAGLH